MMRDLSKISPSFSVLWQIGDFCKQLCLVYMYENNLDIKDNFIAFPDKIENASSNVNTFTILSQDHSYKIIYKLYFDDKEIEIDIKRSNGISTHIGRFKDGKAVINSKWMEVLFESIIDDTMDAVKILIKRYYWNL